MNGGHSSSSIWWRCSAAIFRWLLRLYPRRFREDYSSQMVQDFRDLWEEAALRGGVIGVCQLCWGTLGDLVATAIAERLRKDQTVGRSIIMRVGAVVVWATAVLEALSVQSINLPFPVEVERFFTFNWIVQGFNVVFLAGLVGLQLNYRQRTPWYIWLIGSGTALAFFCWRLLPWLLDQGVILIWGYGGLARISVIGVQTYSAFFAIYLLYSVSMIVWGLSTLVKRVLPPWTDVLLILLGLDSLLQRALTPVVISYPPLPDGFDIMIVPTLLYGTLYGLVRYVLLAGLGYALWADNRPEKAPSVPNEARLALQQFVEGMDSAV